MRRRTLPFAVALLLAAAACGPADVTVTLQLDIPNPEGEGTVTRPLGDIEVQLLPYDRDAVFDSLSAAYPTPEPEIPQDLIDAREKVREAQERWQSLQNRWGTLRDTLEKINKTMTKYSRGEARYVALFREWGDLDDEYKRVQRQMNSAFKEFTELQKGTIQQSDSIRILRENWEDDAFANVGEVFAAKVRASKLRVQVDTSDASGIVRFQAKPGHKYWIHARYELPFSELYWNVPVDVQGRDPLEIKLDRSNAEERIKL